jgi:hypothetical protein
LPKPLPNAKLNPIQHLKEARSRQPAASVALAAGWRACFSALVVVLVLPHTLSGWRFARHWHSSLIPKLRSDESVLEVPLVVFAISLSSAFENLAPRKFSVVQRSATPP